MTDALHLELHFGQDLSVGSQLLSLQATLAATSPQLFATMEVHAHERDPDRMVLDPRSPTALREAVIVRGITRGTLYEALTAENPRPPTTRRFGSALLRGRGRGTSGRYLSVRFDTQIPAMRIGQAWLWSNTIGASVSVSPVEGRPRSDWIEELAVVLAEDQHFLWGAAYLSGEFEASNLDTSEGMRAIGRDIRRHLPGVYWLNLFGRPYVELIYGNGQIDALGPMVRAAGQAIVLKVFEDPEDWEGQESRKRQVAEHLGEDLFFDRARPDRRTNAPDFGLAEPQDQRAPLEVLTSDGRNFTPLPRS